jgi:hypothetical protein
MSKTFRPPAGASSQDICQGAALQAKRGLGYRYLLIVGNGYERLRIEHVSSI